MHACMATGSEFHPRYISDFYVVLFDLMAFLKVMLNNIAIDNHFGVAMICCFHSLN